LQVPANIIDYNSFFLNKKNYKCFLCENYIRKCSGRCDSYSCTSFSYISPAKSTEDITVILNTYRRNDVLLSESIFSFLRQNIIGAKLLIINTHPIGLRLNYDYNNIEIINTGDPFVVYPRQALWSISIVNTPYFCILDDDDIMLPGYLYSLTTMADKYQDEYVQMVTSSKIIDKEGQGVKVGDVGGWGGRMIPKINIKDYVLFFEQRKKSINKFRAIDYVIVKQIFTGMTKVVSLPPRYVARRFNDTFRTSAKVSPIEYFKQLQDYKSYIYGQQRQSVLTPLWGEDYSVLYSGSFERE